MNLKFLVLACAQLALLPVPALALRLRMADGEEAPAGPELDAAAPAAG